MFADQSIKMKHLRLFEEYGSDVFFLIDQLSNFMEFYDEDEFTNHISAETDYDEDQLRNIYKAYWELGTEKFDIMFDFEDWLKSINYGK